MKKMFFLSLILFCIILNAQNWDSLRIFLLDGDMGKTFANPDNSQQQIGYEHNYEKAFNYLGFTTTNGNLVKSTSLPSSIEGYLQYGAMFIVMGNGDPSKITNEDIQRMKAYLDSGGCLMLEGNNVPSYIFQKDSLFLINYFNNKVNSNGGTGYSFYDTLISDTTDPSDPFYRSYKIVYPAGTAPDSSVDILGPKALVEKRYYKSLLNYDDQGKLYKSTTSAYTPPETKAYYFPGKTVMQAVAFSAFADPHKFSNGLPDSIDNQLLRLSYLKDILAFFGIGKTLLVKDDMGAFATDDTLRTALYNLGIKYSRVTVSSGSNGPSWTELMKYSYVIWFTGGVDSVTTLTASDTSNLGVYLFYGGNFILSGENIAQDLGVPGEQTDMNQENIFLSYRLRLDYIGSDVDRNVYYANSDGYFYGHANSKVCSLYNLTPNSKVDYIRPYLRGDHVESLYYFIAAKANYLCALSHQGIMHRTLFFGFPIERLYYNDISSIVKYGYMQYFTCPLGFEPLKWDGTTINETKDSNENKKLPSKTPNIEFSNGFILIENLEKTVLIDASGREVMHLKEGLNNGSTKLKTGIYFVRGFFNSKKVVKKIVVI